MKIPYEQRQLGQFYYCLSNNPKHRYIFQCDDVEGDRFPRIHSVNMGDWDTVLRNSNFKADWKNNADKELRLTTPEEVALIKEKDIEGLLIPFIYSPEIY